MASLSVENFYIFFGWNGEAKDGVNKSHYIALREGMFISDLTAGINNDPAIRNIIKASVRSSKYVVYGEDTCVKVYLVTDKMVLKK